ncbi:type VII secretion protein EccCb [Nocardia macrotermitis]|uniref:Uncharacterized protein n=1 Tax=Nocardia macrotermitis TaxID=2585198 RepID=A0A7K0CYD2_9NOCA|nr:type VII secretion protein EccCb [Nocardia macrotermitis]MQY17654.1 hypothetical protein [Nocardia macrotermitis]
MTSPTGRRLALFVANDTFHSPGIPRLHAPVSDANQLRELLRDPEIGAFAPAEILVNESKAEIERGIERLFRGAEPEDVVLFYFSGHGIRTRHNLYLATSNTDTQLISSSAVSATFIKELIRESPAAAKIILLDCCYSGAFLGGDVIKSQPTVDDVGHELAAGEGICVLTAATAVQVAGDGGAERSAPLSVFTSAVVKGIATGLADNGTGVINTHSLWSYVSAEVRGRTSRQTPSHYGVLQEEVHIARTRRRLPVAVDGGDRVALGTLLGRLEHTPDYGLRAENWWGTGRLTVPIGQQRQPDGGAGETVWLDFSRDDRNLLIVGRAGSGKSTLLRTLIGSLVLTHTPDEVRIMALESSNRVGSLRALPHIARVVGDDEPDQVAALLEEIVGEIRARKILYREQSIDSPTSLRSVRATLPNPVPDLFLLLDPWDEFADLLSHIGQTLKQIAGTGPEYAVHVVATVRDWRDVPDWLAGPISSHIELRLQRPEESHVDRDRALRLPDGPGWALAARQPFRIALPDIRDLPDAAAALPEMTDGAADLVTRVALARQGVSVTVIPHGVAVGRVPALGVESRLNDFAALYRIADPANPELGRRWQPKTGPDRLRIPIGIDGDGRPVLLDFKYAADGGMGPHGLLVGATGSGKSELLRTIVLGLALEHSPEQASFLLIEYKGGGTFGDFAGLPHLAGYIGDLSADLTLVQRLGDALAGELNRRQELFRAAGNVTSIRQYEQERVAGTSLDPLPELFVIIDEFSELLSQAPEFIDVLTAIGRMGRSLGIHLLLASQRLDETTLRGLDAHLSYRVALKTYSLNESRAVLDTPLAYHLPSIPGSGYLKTDSGEPLRFVAASSSRAEPSDRTAGVIEPVDLPLGISLVHAMVATEGPPVHRIWLPPLDTSPTLGNLTRPLPEPMPVALQRQPGLRPAAIGIVDAPRLHTRTPFQLDLAGAQGNVAVIGGPQSGKTTALRTLILALAFAHTPDQVQFYCLDFGGGELAALSGLPHVGSVAGRLDTDRVRRTIAELTELIQRREELFGQLDLSMAEFRRHKAKLVDVTPERRATDPLGADRFGDVFLVIDGYEAVRQDYEELELALNGIAARGLALGVHIVLAASRWSALRPALRDLLGSRVELRLGDPADSSLGRRQALVVPEGSPGRGLTPDGLHMLIALPRLGSSADSVGMAEGIADAVLVISARSGDLRAPEVRMLPSWVTHEELLRAVDRAGQVDPGTDRLSFPIGVDESDLAPVRIDFAATPHMMIFGDAESGKTNLLRLLIRGICASNTPDQAKIVLVDPRRTLLAQVQSGHLANYAASVPSLAELLGELVSVLEKRLPADGVTPQQLRERSWWTGPELYLIVDDYELVAGSNNPMTIIRELLPHGRDIGLHLIVARHTGGASRALYDPVLGMLKDLGSTGLLLSGDRNEGALLGTVRPAPMPAGRGTLVDRRRVELVQTAWTPPLV